MPQAVMERAVGPFGCGVFEGQGRSWGDAQAGMGRAVGPFGCGVFEGRGFRLLVISLKQRQS